MIYLLEKDDVCDLLNYFDIEITDEMIQEHLDQIDIYTELDEFEKELLADMRSDDYIDDYRAEKYYEEQDIIEMFENIKDDAAQNMLLFYFEREIILWQFMNKLID